MNNGGRIVNELKDTIELMNSSDYKDRFKAEYYQLKIRYTKLHAMLVKLELANLISPHPLQEQSFMSNSGIWLSIFVVWKFVRNLRELSFKIFYPRVSIY